MTDPRGRRRLSTSWLLNRFRVRRMYPQDSQITLESIADQLIVDDPDSAPGLPSIDGVIAVTNDLRSVLFPGYGRARRSNATDQFFNCCRLLRHVEARLRVEIGRALESDRHEQIRLHDGSSHGGSQSRQELTTAFLGSLPRLKNVLQEDVAAAFDGDPAAKTRDEIILCYPGLEAITVYRIAHELYVMGIPYIPRMLSEWAHRETGIDIHPGAQIGPRFFIDHGTGVVIGETCVIGSGVTLYQGVTLGAWSFPRDEDGNLIRDQKRHPTLEDNVTVYSNATVLGGTTVVGAGSLVGSSVTLSRSVPPNTAVTIEKPSLRFREAG